MSGPFVNMISQNVGLEKPSSSSAVLLTETPAIRAPAIYHLQKLVRSRILTYILVKSEK